jgi:hypothetical protein
MVRAVWGATRGVALVVVLVACLLPSNAAQAKGPGLDYATLEGPSIGEPLQLADRYPYLLNQAAMSHLFEAAHSPRFMPSRPVGAEELGPRYELAYHLAFGHPLEVDLYPYAANGPLGHVAEGQFARVPVGTSGADVRFPARPGWWSYPPGLINYLQREGLPQPAEAKAGEERPLSWLLALLGALIAFAFCTGRAAAASRSSQPCPKDGRWRRFWDPVRRCRSWAGVSRCRKGAAPPRSSG